MTADMSRISDRVACSHTLLVTVVAGLFSCAAPSPVMSPPPAEAPATVAAAPLIPTVEQLPTPVSSSNLEPAEAPIVEAAKSPFIAVATTEEALRLLPVDGAMLVSHQVFGDDFYGNEIGVVDGTEVSFVDRLRIDGHEWVQTAHGKWPNEVDLLSMSTNGRTGIATRYQLTKTGWKRSDNDMGRAYIGLAKRGNGVLAMKTGTFPPSPPAFVTLRGNPGPRPKIRPWPATCAKEMADLPMVPKVEVFPYAFGGTDSGTVFVAGDHCETKRGSVLEAWRAGSNTSELIDLADVELHEESFFAAGATNDEVLLVTDRRVVRISGTTLATVSVPGPSIDAPMERAVGHDQSLWVLAGGRVFVQTIDGWEDVPLPDGIKASDMAWHDGVLWVAAPGGLFRMKRAGDAEVGVAIDASKSTIPKTLQLPRLGGPSCDANLVVLYQFTEVTPIDYDFPLTRAALRGHTEFGGARFLVTEDNGKKYFTAATPSYKDAVKLAELVRAGVKGSAPTVVCTSPKVLRELNIDLRTGAVVK